MAPGSLDLSLVLVCFNEDMAPLLDELARQRRPGDEVIVVDNYTTSGGTPGVREHPTVDRVIDSPGNLGYAPAVNLGAEGARGDAIVILNPDATPQPGCL